MSMFGNKNKPIAPQKAKTPTRVDNGGVSEVTNEPAAVVIQHRNAFYRDGYRVLVGAIFALCLALLLSLVFNVGQWYLNRDITRDYFSVDNEGRLTPIIPLNSPFLTREQILNWAAEAAVSAYTMDASNYRERAGEIATYFTSEGMSQYTAAMVDSGTIDMIKRETLISSAVPLAVPVIVNEGELDGRHLWRVRVPIRVSYRTAGKGSTSNQMVTLVIIRRSTFESKFGVGISQFVARPATAAEIGS